MVTRQEPAQGKKGVIFSGMRPTGLLHLGNYMGALQNWVSLQEEYDCIYCAVDIHALTTVETPEDIAQIQPNIEDMVLDWLAAGIDPERSIVFVQSHVPEVMTLNSLLAMVTPLGWLMRVPTFKDKVRQMSETEDTVNYGLVGYPVLQTADIILYKADTVPVGQDQVPHLELAREIVRRFNNRFGEIFPEPQASLTEDPLIVGLDGQQKMSKTLDNHLELAATPEETTRRVLTAFTDPQRTRRDIPGRPNLCNVYSLHKTFSPAAEVTAVYDECVTAQRGCVDCKRHLAASINGYLEELRERRESIKQRPGYVKEILADGAAKARAIAQETIKEVYSKMGLT
ncbi:MAG TPA: tryptophan--tRNA ligase [Dehalococcoidia bacterium]|nr:tryptophan--tRNA ligase [Dehalococcoidia bacterium]HAI09099.1 tryptophan--tRNA ligase [Dehalococcoidia bacterium]